MSSSGRAVRTALHTILRQWSHLRFRIKKRTNLLGTPMIVAYRGYERDGAYWLKGRVIEDEGVIGAAHTDSLLADIRHTFRRYETDEVRGAELSWRCGEAKGTATTDLDGYLELVIPAITTGERTPPWTRVTFELLSAPGYEISPLGAEGFVRSVSPRARFGVISDIDDTIVKTGAFDLLKHWRTVVANSAKSRVAFPGVGPFYRALAAGEDGPETNPIFYVSSSPWNLFDLFESFMSLHGIPMGPVLLRGTGLGSDRWPIGAHDVHKLECIEDVLAAFPELCFVLIGDSGQRDASIYAEAARRHPGRILAVHIRDVLDGDHAPEVDVAIAELQALGVPATLEPTLRSAAEQAAAAGLIARDAVTDVVRVGEGSAIGFGA